MNLLQRILAVVMPARVQGERTYLPMSQAGVAVTEDTALTFSAVWACVSVISRTIAALPWLVFERTLQGRMPVDGAVRWLLQHRPNPEMTAFSFRETLMLHVLTWGNAYAEIQRDLAGRVVALWPISPDRVCIERDEVTKELVYRVRGGNGEWVPLAPADVLHLHGMGFDGIYGYSPIRMAARSLGLGIAQDVFGAAFYANGTVFGQLVEMPAGLSPEQIKDAEGYLNERAGPSKAFRAKVAPSGVKVHQLSMPLTDAQFLESRKFSINEVARWFGVPPHKIGDLERSTNNNIEHQGIEFVIDAIVPWAVRLEQEANGKLFGARAQGRVYTKLMTGALMRGDAKSRGEFYRTMLQLGVMTVNEVRELEDLNGIGSAGDVHLVQLNQTTLEHLAEHPGGVEKPRSDGPAAPDPDHAEDHPAGEQPPTNVLRRDAMAWWRSQAGADWRERNAG